MNRTSVVIPCYNQGNYLADALRSCTEQTHLPDEIIVVNDGSDASHTAQIEAAIAACPMPVCYIPQQNSGVAHARNVGWRAARGDFIQLLDADDVLLPDKIARCLREFESAPEAAIVYTDYETRTADLCAPVPQPMYARPIPERDTLAVMLANVSSFFGTCCTLIRRDWLERVGGFNEGLKITEDWYMWIAMASHGAQFRYIPEKLAWVRFHAAGSSKHALNLAEARLRAYEALSALPIPPGIFDAKGALAARHHMLALRLWEAGRAPEARTHFRQAIVLQPTGRTARRLLLGLSRVTSARTAERLMAGLGAVVAFVRRRGKNGPPLR